ncbi:MAG: molybdopterin-dependent oxidoreductase [Candidatus Villigracilaceae bacterium]
MDQAAGPENEPPRGLKQDEMGNLVNSYQDITHYNNFYEFSTDKAAVARLAENFRTSPWTLEVYGLVNRPHTFGVEDLLRLFPQEGRIYRLRCCECQPAGGTSALVAGYRAPHWRTFAA